MKSSPPTGSSGLPDPDTTVAPRSQKRWGAAHWGDDPNGWERGEEWEEDR